MVTRENELLTENLLLSVSKVAQVVIILYKRKYVKADTKRVACIHFSVTCYMECKHILHEAYCGDSQQPLSFDFKDCSQRIRLLYSLQKSCNKFDKYICNDSFCFQVLYFIWNRRKKWDLKKTGSGCGQYELQERHVRFTA